MKIIQKNAFTLIEILVVIFVFSIICVIGSEFLIRGFKSVRFNEEQEMAIQQARDAMDEMTKTIRGANYSENCSEGIYYVLGIADEQEIEFYSDLDSDYKMEKIRYYLEDLQIKRSVIKPTVIGGNLHSYNSEPDIKIIANYVNNIDEPIFIYYNSNMEILGNGFNINEVRSVAIHLKINVTPEMAPGDYTLESSVQLRNLKYK